MEKIVLPYKKRYLKPESGKRKSETYSTTASKSLALQNTCFASVPKSTCETIHGSVQINSNSSCFNLDTEKQPYSKRLSTI